jgi:hypothetical protein
MDLMLPAGRAFHLGYVVPDLDRAMTEMGRVWGLDWAPMIRRSSWVMDARRGRMDIEIGVVYSTTGPPHFELIEGAEDTIWAPRPRPYLHHVGRWAADLEADAALLQGSGATLVAHGLDGEGNMARFSYHEDPSGPYIELVDPAARDALGAWLSGEPLDLGTIG